MAVVTDSKGRLFQPHTCRTEAEFEKTVVKLADQIFGSSAIYVDVKKQVRGEFVTIPDGYVIDMADVNDPTLFIVENEISSHDAFRHVGIQLLKFVTSFEDAQTSVREFLMDEIADQPKAMELLRRSCEESNSRNIDNYLDKAVYSDFRGVVIIDEATPALHKVLKNIRANISVLELKTYVAESGDKLYQIDTLYDEYENDPMPESHRSDAADVRAARRARRAASDTIVVPAREDGFKEVFLGEHRWHAVKIGAAMKKRIKYIAAYQVAPESAITHIAEIKEILPYENTSKYEVVFEAPATEISKVQLSGSRPGPQGPFYCKRDVLLKAKTLDEILAS